MNDYFKAYLSDIGIDQNSTTYDRVKSILDYYDTLFDNNELLNLCKSLKLHTVKPTIIVNNNLYAKVKHNLDNSIIISISINKYTERELTTTIRYLKSKGYNIVTLNNLLIEKN